MNDLSRTLMSLFATGFNPRLYVACMLLGRTTPADRDPKSAREGRQS
jgi:hypothetical protein